MVEVTWFVVADGGRARVFKMPGLTLDLQEVEVLVNDEYTGTVLTEKDREKFAKRVSRLSGGGTAPSTLQSAAPRHRGEIPRHGAFESERGHASTDIRADQRGSAGAQYPGNRGASAQAVIG